MTEYQQDPWSTHLSLLTAALSVARPGPVLELGGGIYSTRVLSAMCKATDRDLVTADGDYNWVLELQKSVIDLTHIVCHANHWGECIADWAKTQWAVVLVDHWPPDRRGGDLLALANSAEFLVCHDVEDQRHGWGDAIASFKFRTFDTRQAPHTACVSMIRELWAP